jgi:diadenosine tetraphosphate (Ap4A) HIT family hydrolase
VFDDVQVMGVMTIRPQHVGHVLLFPNEHVEDFACMDQSARGNLFHVAARLSRRFARPFPVRVSTC